MVDPHADAARELSAERLHDNLINREGIELHHALNLFGKGPVATTSSRRREDEEWNDCQDECNGDTQHKFRHSHRAPLFKVERPDNGEAETKNLAPTKRVNE